MVHKVAILQPSYIPWLGYFDQINKVDTFVFYDDVLYTKNDWRNRNKIKTSQGATWLTIPVNIQNRITNYLLIKDVKLIDKNILKNHLQIIESNYKKAPFFKEVYSVIAPIFTHEHILLSELTINIIKVISAFLGIKNVRFLKSSDMNISSQDPTERLINICKSLNATHYLTGASAKNYLDEKMFRNENIQVTYQEYAHPTYNQLWDEFIPYLSIIDLLCNEGNRSLDILSNKNG